MTETAKPNRPDRNGSDRNGSERIGQTEIRVRFLMFRNVLTQGKKEERAEQEKNSP